MTTYEIYRLVFIIGAVACGVMLAVAAFLFFFLKIPKVISDLTGRTARLAIEDIRRQNEASGDKTFRSSSVNLKRGRVTDKISGSGRIQHPPQSIFGVGMATEKIATQNLHKSAGARSGQLPAHQQPGFHSPVDPNTTTVLPEVELTTVLPENQAPVNETTLLPENQIPVNETTLLPENQVPAANETTILAENQVSAANETTLLPENHPADETAVLAPTEETTVLYAPAETTVLYTPVVQTGMADRSKAFVVEREITYIHTQEVIRQEAVL